MAIYASGITPLLAWLSILSNKNIEQLPSRQVGFTDDLDGVGLLKNLEKWWNL